MKCPWCSVENTLGTEECVSCGRTLFISDSANGFPREHTNAPSNHCNITRQGGRRCTACGRPIDWDANHCQYCGYNYRLRQPSIVHTPVALAPSSISAGKIAAGILIAFVIIIVILFILFTVLPSVIGSSATLRVNVHSAHIFSTVTFNVYVDGSLIKSGSVTPGYYYYFNYEHEWPSSDPTTVTVSATSTGGTLGSYSDSDSFTVTDGGYYTVDLYI